MARTQTNTQNNTKHVEQQDATDIQKNYFVVFLGFLFYFLFLNDFFKKCWVNALVRSRTFIGGLNQFKAIANLTHSQPFLEKKKNNCAVTLQPGHLKAEQNNTKVGKK